MTESVHTLTIYGKNLRVIVQAKGLNQKQGSEVAAHFEKTIGQAILDAPHVGIMREHQIIERLDPPTAAVMAAPSPIKTHPLIKPPPTPALAPAPATDRAGRPLKAAKKAKKARKRG